jgi:hypothetical protein
LKRSNVSFLTIGGFVAKKSNAYRISAVGLLLLIMALPRRANAYVDPGSGAMLWQVAAAGIFGSFFYARRAGAWIRQHCGLHSPRSMGFLFASFYSLAATPVVCGLIRGHAVPRFNDIFLVGIVLTAYLFTWEPAAFLLAVSMLISAYILPPYGTLRLELASDWYRLGSFFLVSVFLISIVTRLKKRREVEARETGKIRLRIHSLAS